MLLDQDISAYQRIGPSGAWGDMGGRDRSFSRRGRKASKVRIGLLVPFSGADAIWGPSCQYSAVLAAALVNASGGILDREIELFAANAGGPPQQVVGRVEKLISDHSIDVLVGVHLSSVRIAISEQSARHIPYVFAPQYEGGETTRGVLTIGETPIHQYRDAIKYMVEKMGAKRWYLLGNDYIWPRQTSSIVKQLVIGAGAAVVGEGYLPLHSERHSASLQEIESARPDIVFECLVGSDSVTFNREFGAADMSRGIIRLSGAIDENTLMGIGEIFSKNLYCVAGYFNSLKTSENVTFLKEYRMAFGENAPLQGVMSQSCYESILFLSALAKKAGSFDIDDLMKASRRFTYLGARGRVRISDQGGDMDCHLMRADGLEYELIKTFRAD